MESRLFIQPLLQIVVIIPLLLIFMDCKSRKNCIRILSVIFCYYMYSLFDVLPSFSEHFWIINSSWNWEGKFYGTLCGVAMYYIFRKQFVEYDFFTIKQNKGGLKSSMWVVVAVVSYFVLVGVIASKDYDLETLLFQISMPGIEEEIIYRGVLLGLMSSMLRCKYPVYRNPAIIINGILFGLGHALILQGGEITFGFGAFFSTGIVGYALAYITFQTKSILIPVLTHNVCNFTKNLLSMI